MAWRPAEYLIEGELDNSVAGKITGWMRFAGMADRVTLKLTGDFAGDIQGKRVRVTGPGDPEDTDAVAYMEPFAEDQVGDAGLITGGFRRPGQENVRCIIEWIGRFNGRVVIELPPGHIQVIG